MSSIIVIFVENREYVDTWTIFEPAAFQHEDVFFSRSSTLKNLPGVQILIDHSFQISMKMVSSQTMSLFIWLYMFLLLANLTRFNPGGPSTQLKKKYQ